MKTQSGEYQGKNRLTAKPPPATTTHTIMVYTIYTHRDREEPTGEDQLEHAYT